MTNYTDLIARLRWDNGMDKPSAIELEAADKIERLRTNLDYWVSAAQTAQEHRDGANAQLAIAEAEIESLRSRLAEVSTRATEYTGALGACHRQIGELQGELVEAEALLQKWIQPWERFGNAHMKPDGEVMKTRTFLGRNKP